ncbi:hypothetical protein ACRYWZ_13735 [Agrobacterium deltaense]|uniref:hypothetical protein n=1 Tax=Agrobacterium deltaense TaxID=1183412 RepID=UPI003D9A0189
MKRHCEENQQHKIAIEINMISTIPAIATTTLLSGLFVDTHEKFLTTLIAGSALFFLAGWLKCKVTGEEVFSKRNKS